MIPPKEATTQTAEATTIFRHYLYRRYGERSTPKPYMSDLAIFLRQLGDKPLPQVTAQDIDHFINVQHQQGLAASTIKRRLVPLHTFFACLAAQAPDEVWPNPVHRRRHRVKQAHLLPRAASDPDVARLWASSPRPETQPW